MLLRYIQPYTVRKYNREKYLAEQKDALRPESWDANSGKTAEALLFRLAALPMIADRKLCQAAKDVSNAGILGTTSIMLENSAKGGLIDLASIPRPDGMALKDWLLSFQSFGFIQNRKPGSLSQVRDDRLCHRSSLFLVSGVRFQVSVKIES